MILREFLETYAGSDFLDIPLAAIETLSVEWTQDQSDPDAGFFTIDVKFFQGGSSHMSGTHHPRVICEGNPCRYCGHAYWEEGFDG